MRHKHFAQMVLTFINLFVANLIEVGLQITLEIRELRDFATCAKGPFWGRFFIALDKANIILRGEIVGTIENFVQVRFGIHNDHREFAARMSDYEEVGSDTEKTNNTQSVVIS